MGRSTGMLMLAAVLFLGFGSRTVADDAIEGKRLDAAVVRILPAQQSTDDGFWTWLPRYRELRYENRQRIHEIRFELGLLAKDIRLYRAQWLRLLYQDNVTVPSVKFDPAWNSFFGDLLREEMREELRAEMDDIFYRWTGAWVGAPIQTRPISAGRQTAASFRSARDVLRTRINDARERQRRRIDEAIRLHQALAASIRGQARASGERRPGLSELADSLEAEEEMLRLQLYDSAELYQADELPALAEKLARYLSESEEIATLVQAKRRIALARADEEKIQLQMIAPAQRPPDPMLVMAARTSHLEAIRLLRRVAEINPDNTEARALLQVEELMMVGQIAAKLHQERELSFVAFQEYIKARGISSDDPKTVWNWLWDYSAGMWGLGPVGSAAAFTGLPMANAELAGAQQMDAARKQSGLLMVARLLRNGAMLTRIPKLSREEFQQLLAPRSATLELLPPERVTALYVEMRLALAEMPALARLTSGDPFHLAEDVNQAMGARHYELLDSSYHWYEWFGDLMNIKNLVTLWGPNAIVGAYGRLAAHPAHLPMTAAQLSAAENAGEVVTTMDWMARALRLDRMAEIAQTTNAGKVLARSLSRRRLIASQGGLTGAANATAEMMAMGAFSGGVAVLLTQNNAHPIAADLLGELLVGLAGSRFAAGSLGQHIVRADEIDFVLKNVDETIAAVRVRQAANRDALADLSNHIRLRQSGPLPALPAFPGQRMSALAQSRQPEAALLASAVSFGSPEDAVEYALRHGAIAAKHADLAEAGRAAEAAASIAEIASRRAEEMSSRISAARTVILKKPSVAPVSPQLKAPSLPARNKNGVLEPVPLFWQPSIYADDEIGRFLLAGDLMVRDGNFEQAAYNYRSALDRIQLSDRPDRHYSQLVHAEHRLQLSSLAADDQRIRQALQAQRPEPPPIARIGFGEYQEAVATVESGGATTAPGNSALHSRSLAGDDTAQRLAAGRNQASMVQTSGGRRFVVKKPVSFPGEQITEADLKQAASMEAACTEFARLVGVPTAPARAIQESGEVISLVLPNATPFADLHEHSMLALKQDYANARAFRIWLGDADGHFNNILLDEFARLVQIDFDLATFSNRSRHLGDTFSTQAELMRSVSTIHRHQRGHGPYQWMARMDETLRFDDMRETVRKITELADLHRSMESAGGTGVLRKILVDAGYDNVDEAVNVLLERADSLEKVLREVFDRDNLPAPLRPQAVLNLASATRRVA